MRFSNPYSAARFAPGQIAWLAAEPALDIPSMFERASRPGARHQILGPHGSGKSTLLRHLELHALRTSAPVVRYRGSEGIPLMIPDALVLLDEWEELSAWSRLRLRLSRRSLVVSAHSDEGFPTLARCEADANVARHVIAELRGGEPPRDLEARLARHAGNLREVLFELYDEVEASRPAALTSRGFPSSAPSARDR